MAETAQFVRFGDSNPPFTLSRCGLPSLAPGELLVQILGTTIAPVDLDIFSGRRSVALPCVLGRETFGRVVALGAGELPLDVNGGEVRIGQRITWHTTIACGNCEECDAGFDNWCRAPFTYGEGPFDPEAPLRAGGFSSYGHLAAGMPVVSVPSGVPDAVVPPATWTIAKCSAMFARLSPPEATVVVVLGCDFLGLIACAMARWVGAEAVVAVDSDGERVEQATRFGATVGVTFDRSDKKLSSSVRDLTAGRGAGMAVLTRAEPAFVTPGIEVLAFGGALAVIGEPDPAKVALGYEALVGKSLRVEGVSRHVSADVVDALTFLRDACRDYPFADLCSERIPLSEIGEAFRIAGQRSTQRVTVVSEGC